MRGYILHSTDVEQQIFNSLDKFKGMGGDTLFLFDYPDQHQRKEFMDIYHKCKILDIDFTPGAVFPDEDYIHKNDKPASWFDIVNSAEAWNQLGVFNYCVDMEMQIGMNAFDTKDNQPKCTAEEQERLVESLTWARFNCVNSLWLYGWTIISTPTLNTMATRFEQLMLKETGNVIGYDNGKPYGNWGHIPMYDFNTKWFSQLKEGLIAGPIWELR